MIGVLVAAATEYQEELKAVGAVLSDDTQELSGVVLTASSTEGGTQWVERALALFSEVETELQAA